MNINETIAQACAISVTVKDAVLVGLAWSGASRIANHITGKKVMNDADYKTAESMARVASQVTTDRIRPTADEVIALLKQAPEMTNITPAERQAFIDAGDTDEEIDAELQAEHQESLNRHAKDIRGVVAKEADIREALDTLFTAKTRVLPSLPESMGELKASVIRKVSNRSRRVVTDVSYGRLSSADGVAEKQAIKSFLAQAA